MTLLQQPILWLILAEAAVIIVIAVRKHKARSEWGFKDIVKNPDYWEGASKAMQDIDATARAAQSWSDEKVADLTRRFVLEIKTSRDAQADERILRELGKRTHPTVLELFRDSNLYNRLVNPTGKNLLPEAPFNRACDLLGDAPPPQAVDLLAPFLKDPSKEIRKDAAMAIAKTGAASITSHLRQAFSDSDEYVRSYALMGLEFAIDRAGLAANVAHELFPDVLKLLEENKNADSAADILFQFDAAKATEFFLSPNVFKADCPILHEVLETLRKASIPVNRERLLELISSLESGQMKYPRTYALGEALQLLGQHRQTQDREFLHARTSHIEHGVAEGAAAGLLSCYGLEGFEKRIWEIEKESGYEALLESQKFYCAVFICDAEINNGGLAQYFVNPSGNRWRDAIDGFEAMGFKERLQVLTEAIALFGSNGPSTDREARQDQLSELYQKNDSIFDALDSRYYKSKEIVQVLANQFVLDHPDSFR